MSGGDEADRSRRVRGGPDGPLTSIVDRYAWLSAVRADVAAIRRLPKDATPPEQRLTADAVVVASAIADRINAEMGYAWPRLTRRKGEEPGPRPSTLDEMTGLSERGVRGIVDQLVARGHLYVVVSRGPGASNRYYMLRQDGNGPTSDDEQHGGKNRNDGAGIRRENRHDGAGIRGNNRNGGAGLNRHGGSDKTGTVVPPNASTERIDSNAAATQPAGVGGKAKIVRSTSAPSPNGLPGQPANDLAGSAPVVAEGRSKALDAAWSAIVGPDLAGRLGSTDALHRAIAAGEFTEADVEAGVRDGLAKGDTAPARWRYFLGWASEAKKRRIGSGRPRPVDDLGGVAVAPAPAPSGYFHAGGSMHSLARGEAAVRDFDQTGTWSFEFGLPPDDPRTELPPDLRRPSRKPARSDPGEDGIDARNTA